MHNFKMLCDLDGNTTNLSAGHEKGTTKGWRNLSSLKWVKNDDAGVLPVLRRQGRRRVRVEAAKGGRSEGGGGKGRRGPRQ